MATGSAGKEQKSGTMISWYAGAAVLSIALGFGVNAAIFAIGSERWDLIPGAGASSQESTLLPGAYSPYICPARREPVRCTNEGKEVDGQVRSNNVGCPESAGGGIKTRILSRIVPT